MGNMATNNPPDGTFINSEGVQQKYKAEWRITIENWMVNEGPKYLFMLFWTGANCVLFFQAFFFYYSLRFTAYSNDWTLLGFSLPVARGSASVLNFNCGAILITVCRNLITLLRNTFINRIIPLDKNITFHQVIAWTILLMTLLHIGAHYFNMLHIQFSSPQVQEAAGLPVGMTAAMFAMGTLPGISGHIILVCMFIMYTSAIERMRRRYFEAFWYSHHLFVVFFAFLLSHASQCYIHANNYTPPCIPNAWKYCVLGLFLYLIERIVREVRGRFETYVSKVVQHPSKVVEVQMKKPSFKYKPGQYLFLHCPEVSMFEWHPFTISSAPEEDFVSVHVRVVGDFTTAFAKKLGCKFDKDDNSESPSALPKVMIDGPFGSASEDVFKFEVAVLVGAGIGVTPFSSILKSIWYRVVNPNTVMKMRKCYFYWICRDTNAFEWFQDLLEALEAEDIDNFLEIHMFMTGGLKADQVRNVVLTNADGRDALTGLRSPTHYGRPNFDQIFGQMASTHPSTDIGIFFCGPKPLSHTLHRAANKNTSSVKGGTKFYYHKENF